MSLGCDPADMHLCCAQVCEQAGVQLHVVPLTEQYWDRVVASALADIRAGRTPNPDMLCNSRCAGESACGCAALAVSRFLHAMRSVALPRAPLHLLLLVVLVEHACGICVHGSAKLDLHAGSSLAPSMSTCSSSRAQALIASPQGTTR